MDPLLEIPQQLLRYITADKSALYVISPFNIGDFLINGGLCYALLKKKRKQTCVLIERDRFMNCGLNFVGVQEVRYISQTLMNLIRRYIHTTREYETDNYIYGHFHVKPDAKNFNANFIWNDNQSFVDRYKHDVFRLPMDTELLPPIIEPLSNYQKQHLHENYVLDKKRTIILMPHAKYMPAMENFFWTKLISKLTAKNKDYVFYTNVANSSEEVISGTAPMTTTFPELVYLAEKVNCFIGLRSGIFDLLAFTNARLLYINSSIETWWFDLNLNFNHSNNRAFYMAVNDKADIRNYMKQNDVKSINDLVFYDCVNGSDLAFDAHTLLEKILSAVD